MQKLIIFVALLGVAAAMPQFSNAPRPATRPAPRPAPGPPGPSARTGEDPRRQQEREAVITKYESDSDAPGSFTYTWEASDGSGASARGLLLPPTDPTGKPVQEIQGFYTYAGDDGPVRFDYVANNLGFQVQGDAVPKPFPIPEAIRLSLEEIFAGIAADGKTSKDELDAIRARYNY